MLFNSAFLNMRKALDGHSYTKEEFLTYYGPRGEAMWNQADPSGAAEPAGASAAAVPGSYAPQSVSEPLPSTYSLLADEGAHLAEPLPAHTGLATGPPTEHPHEISCAAKPPEGAPPDGTPPVPPRLTAPAPSPHTPIDVSACAEDSTQHHVNTSTGTVAPSTVRRMDGSILEVDLSGANNVGEARRRVAAATRNNPDRVRLVDGYTVLDDQHAVASGDLSLAILATPPTVVFASLNIGLQRDQACGRNAQRKFNAIARGIQQAFERVRVDAMGLVEVGDAVDGLPQHEAAQLLDTIRAHMPDIQLVFHANATGHPYMLLSKAGSNANLTDVRVVQGFVGQQDRKALRARLAWADGVVDLWLVNLASSRQWRLTMNVRQGMLAHLATGRPTVIAGDIHTQEFELHHWMRNAGAAFSPCLACSGANPPLYGDYTIATKMLMWELDHRIGKSFEAEGVPPVDRVSDAHDMVCVVLSCTPQRKRVTTDAAALGCRPEEVASSSRAPTAADGAVLDNATDPVASPEEDTSSSEDSATADADELGGATDPMTDLQLDPDEAARFRDQGARAVFQTQQALLQPAADSVDFARSSSDEERAPPNNARRGAFVAHDMV